MVNQGGRTPFGAGRTPARPGTTPGYASVRQAAATPNPYGGATPRYGGGGGPPPSNSFGHQTPSQQGAPFAPPGNMPPPGGMNPQRAAMIQQEAGRAWGS